MGSSVKEGGDVVWCMAMVCGREKKRGSGSTAANNDGDPSTGPVITRQAN